MSLSFGQMLCGKLEVPKCSVCLEDMNCNLATIECGHVFHDICIYESVSRQSQCPLCRTKTFTSQIRSLNFEIASQSPAKQQIIDKLEQLTDFDKDQIINQIAQNQQIIQQNKQFKEDINQMENKLQQLQTIENSYLDQNRKLSELDKQHTILKNSYFETQQQCLVLESECQGLRDRMERMEETNHDLKLESRKVNDFRKLYFMFHNEEQVLRTNRALQKITNHESKFDFIYEKFIILNGNYKQSLAEIRRLENQNYDYDKQIKTFNALQKKQDTQIKSLKQILNSKKKEIEELKKLKDQQESEAELDFGNELIQMKSAKGIIQNLNFGQNSMISNIGNSNVSLTDNNEKSANKSDHVERQQANYNVNDNLLNKSNNSLSCNLFDTPINLDKNQVKNNGYNIGNLLSNKRQQGFEDKKQQNVDNKNTNNSNNGSNLNQYVDQFVRKQSQPETKTNAQKQCNLNIFLKRKK